MNDLKIIDSQHKIYYQTLGALMTIHTNKEMMASNIEINNNFSAINIEGTKKQIIHNTIAVAVIIITIVGILLATNMPELYLRSTWSAASNLMRFKIILAQLPLAIGCPLLFYAGLNFTYDVYLRAKDIYNTVEPTKEFQ